MNEEQKRPQQSAELCESPRQQFGALAYRTQDLTEASFTILLVLRGAEGGLSFLVEPDWQSMVPDADLNYIEALFDDFRERARQTPGGLFEQLCSLGVGPLVTQEVGKQISDYPQLLALLPRFVPL